MLSVTHAVHSVHSILCSGPALPRFRRRQAQSSIRAGVQIKRLTLSCAVCRSMRADVVFLWRLYVLDLPIFRAPQHHHYEFSSHNPVKASCGIQKQCKQLCLGAGSEGTASQKQLTKDNRRRLRSPIDGELGEPRLPCHGLARARFHQEYGRDGVEDDVMQSSLVWTRLGYELGQIWTPFWHPRQILLVITLRSGLMCVPVNFPQCAATRSVPLEHEAEYLKKHSRSGLLLPLPSDHSKNYLIYCVIVCDPSGNVGLP